MTNRLRRVGTARFRDHPTAPARSPSTAALRPLASEGGVISTADTLGVVVNGVAAGRGRGQRLRKLGDACGPTTALNGNQNTGFTDGRRRDIDQGPTSIAVWPVHGRASAFGRGHSFGLAERVTTSQASSIAFAARDFATIIAWRRNRLAGSAITFMDAANAVATFDNFNIKSTAGDFDFR